MYTLIIITIYVRSPDGYIQGKHFQGLPARNIACLRYVWEAIWILCPVDNIFKFSIKICTFSLSSSLLQNL